MPRFPLPHGEDSFCWILYELPDDWFKALFRMTWTAFVEISEMIKDHSFHDAYQLVAGHWQCRWLKQGQLQAVYSVLFPTDPLSPQAHRVRARKFSEWPGLGSIDWNRRCWNMTWPWIHSSFYMAQYGQFIEGMNARIRLSVRRRVRRRL